jgi:hypothetical protein
MSTHQKLLCQSLACQLVVPLGGGAPLKGGAKWKEVGHWGKALEGDIGSLLLLSLCLPPSRLPWSEQFSFTVLPHHSPKSSGANWPWTETSENGAKILLLLYKLFISRVLSQWQKTDQHICFTFNLLFCTLFSTLSSQGLFNKGKLSLGTDSFCLHMMHECIFFTSSNTAFCIESPYSVFYAPHLRFW